ncbi:helix-turn-helix domain-containing protein [Paenibacillus hodogayensis]|uniref:Helix-turn-helix domain-containing protein n=1 Tax=Paenibacillus hodogayensis TaxID=279208 RepID=A0ABV5VYG9_9BACL
MIRMENFYFDDFIPNWRKPITKTTQYVVIWVVQGKFAFVLDRDEHELSRGDVLIVRPGTVRSGSNGVHPPHQKYIAHFQMEPSTLDKVPLLAASKGYELFKTNKPEYLRQRFSMLFQSWMDKRDHYEFICHGIMTEIFGAMLQELSQQRIPSHKLRVAKQIETYMLEHYREEITIGRLCELVQLSPSYVIGIFKEVYLQTPIEFIHQIRISIASDLLLQSAMNISEVSDYLGFCDPTYFNRVFKKVTGRPPSSLLKERKAYALRADIQVGKGDVLK